MNNKIYEKSIFTPKPGTLTPPEVKAELARHLAATREELVFHMPYSSEQKLLQLIQNGEDAALIQLLSGLAAQGLSGAQVGTMSADRLKQAFCICVSGITIFTRSAIEGGLNEEIAYGLSDAYINAAGKKTDADALMRFFALAAVDFARRVREEKGPNTACVKKCRTYISNHLHERITLRRLAAHCALSPNYLSAQFKAQLGMPPAAYIRMQKLALSREWLSGTNTSVGEIAMQLGFCSSSNFSGHFKAQYGITPLAYRNKP